MQELIDSNWKKVMQTSLNQPYFKELSTYIKTEYSNYCCYPEPPKVFEALNLCSFNNIKVVILGQDPYHNPKQAHGLSFSVTEDTKHPPSLVNIFKELNSDLNISYPQNGNLEPWARQGVLLLNSILTVRKNEPGSHQNKGWEIFTDAIIKKISKEQTSVVFMLWGGYAKKKAKLIDSQKHLVLTSGHPSPLSANRGYWFGNKHFSKCNYYLESNNKSKINW